MSSISGNRDLFFQHIAQTSRFPLAMEITGSKGVYLTNAEGARILDMISGISVSALGHNHPEIVDAVKTQADKYMHTMVYGEFVLSPQVKLADLLIRQLPKQLNSVYYGSSGTEVIEGALKLAVKSTGRRKVIAAVNAYHGSTAGAMSLMSTKERVHPFVGRAHDVRHIGYNQLDDLYKIDDQTACVIMETIQAESGVYVASKEYMQALRNKCNEVGALLIFDEIQAGMCRTGKLFAFEHYAIVPDILVLAKAFGGGMPLGAFISDKERMDCFTENPILGHITTFGGHPVCCAAGLASLNIMLREQLWEKARELGALLDRVGNHHQVHDFRRIGLWAAADLGSMERVLKVVENCLARGLLIDWFLFNDHSLRICPPLIIEEDELTAGITLILEVLNEL
jgi:acetylornithine/succinyldiaminopimelate/putrescine aminotransferase